MHLRLGFFALLLSLVPLFASASTYNWNGFSTPLEYCEANKGIHTGVYVEMKNDSTLALCWGRHSLGAILNFGQVARSGDSCDGKDKYDPATGQCVAPEPDKCESTIGQVVSHQHKIGTLSEGGVVLVNTRVDPPGNVCDNACQYASTGEAPTKCYRFVTNGDPNSGYCVFRYRGNGVSCPNTDTKLEQPPPALPPTSDKSNECTNKVTDAEGRVHYSCLTTDAFQEPGVMQCGEVNGVYGCKAGKPSPQKKVTDTKTETKETPSSDGRKTTETTTTTTVTTCNGANACTTTTTVNNSSGKTNSDGTSGGESSSCTGPGCKPATGTGEEPTEEEEKDKDEVTGDQCGQPLSCSGDVIQCAILKQQKQSRCDWNYEDAKAGIESELAKDEYQVKEDEHDMSGLFQQAIGASRWLPAACPAPERGSLHTRGAGSVQLSWQPTCDFASGVGPFLVAAASIFFAVYVGRGIGGGA